MQTYNYKSVKEAVLKILDFVTEQNINLTFKEIIAALAVTYLMTVRKELKDKCAGTVKDDLLEEEVSVVLTDLLLMIVTSYESTKIANVPKEQLN